MENHSEIRQRKKHRGRYIAAGILAVLGIYLMLVCLPYRQQAGVSEQTVQDFQQSDYYGDTVGGDRAMLLTENEEALAERIRLISQAEERIILSTFDFKSDNSGKKMLAALCDAAGRGVEVQVLVDGFPYLAHMMGDRFFRALGSMEQAEIRVYNPVSLLKPQTLMARMHDKYLIADDTAYILGGRNTYDYFLGNQTDYVNYDWDVLVCAASGDSRSSLNQVEEYFQSVWALEDCVTVMDSEKRSAGVRKAAEELEALYASMRTDHADWFEEADDREQTVETNQIRLMTNPITPERKEPVVFYEMTELMRRSGEAVTFHTPYIMCSDYMLERLALVCSANEEVRMMTNSAANNGNPFGASDYRIHRQELLDTGLRILEYDQGVSYHGKCFTIGDRLTAVGSFNWDMRSAYLNTEVMLVIDSAPLTARMKEEMARYEADALPVNSDGSYELKDGQKPQEMSAKQKWQLMFLDPVNGWLRFLM